MILYYAVGGGLGHLVRARAVLHTLGLEARAALLAASPHACDPRIVGGLPVHLAPADSEGDRDGYARWVLETVRRLEPEMIFVDTFPAGLVGELAELSRVTRAELVYVGRLLRWSIYAAATGADPRAFRFDRAYLVEPLHADHEAAIRAACGGIQTLALRDPPVEDAGLPAELAGLPEKFWLVVHSGPRAEIDELVAYARALQRIERAPAPLVVASPHAAGARDVGDAGQARMDQIVVDLHVDLHPLGALVARAARVVSAAGFNVMRQMAMAPLAERHRFMPLPRRFDDQFARAARRRGAPVVGASPSTGAPARP